MEKTDKVYSSYITNGIINRNKIRINKKIIQFLFRKIDFDAESISTINEYSKKGSVVYASFQSSNTSLLILINLLIKHNFIMPGLALGFTPFVLQRFLNFFIKVSTSFIRFFQKKRYDVVSNYDYIEGIIKSNNGLVLSLLSKKLFLKRYLDIKTDSIQYLVDVQKSTDTPIYIFPQIMFWNRNPERTKTLITSRATGDRGLLSAVFTNYKSATPAFMRISTPINIKDEIAAYSTDDTKQITRKIRNKLLEIYNNEKRTILGPVMKSQQEMMEKILYHKNILDTIQAKVQEGDSEKKLRKIAYKYFKEIAADFSIVMIRVFDRSLVPIFKKIFDGIHYNPEDFKKIRELSQKGPLVFVPCHKSHIDYLIVSSFLYRNKIIPPHILAGSNLTFFPMGMIFRKSGAFFMRRTFKGLELYSSVFRQYVKSLVNEGYSIEFFIEGGRTRTGKISNPKMGMLKYLIEAIDEGYNKDLIFIPTSINYDRILEETSYSNELKGMEKKTESTSSFVKSRQFLKRRYGKVHLSFNEPLFLNEFRNNLEKGEDETIAIADHICKKINDIIMVTPVALTTTAILLSTERGFSHETLMKKVTILHDYIKLIGAKTSDILKAESDLEETINNVLESYHQDRIINELNIEKGKKDNTDDLKGYYALNEEDRPRINFYKNSIIHYLLPVSFLSISLLSIAKKSAVSKDKIKDEFLALKDLFTIEFVYPFLMDDTDRIINTILEYFENRNIISRDKEKIKIDNNGIEELIFYSRAVQDYLESYLIVIDTIINHKKARTNNKDLIYEIRKNGVKMYHMNEVKLYESLSMPNYNNALKWLTDSNIINMEQVGKKDSMINIIDIKGAEAFNEIITRYITKIIKE